MVVLHFALFKVGNDLEVLNRTYTYYDIILFHSAARSVAEAAPTWLSPTDKSSSILVLLGEELLLECIAAGV